MKPPFARALAGTLVLAAGLTIAVTAAPSVSAATTGPTTFSFTGPPVPIPDAADLSGNAPGAPADATVTVAGMPGFVTDVDLTIDGTSCSATAGSTTVGIDHTFVNDLELTLIAPDGTPVKVIDNTDGSGNNFCQVVLDDDAGGPNIQTAVTAQAPFTGTWAPANPLSAFDGVVANGTWTLRAQDFFSQDVGNIRAFSVVVTAATNDLTATKTVAGTFAEGGAITYTVVLTNGPFPLGDNPGNEFVDVLTSNLTLVGATADAGTVVADTGTNTITWNGSLAAAGTATITIDATVDAGTGGTVISNQGQLNFDSDGDGTNDAVGLTDDPGPSGVDDVTSFQVAAQATTTTSTTSTTPTTTAPSSTTTTAAVNGGTLPRTGGRATAGPAQVGLGLFLAGVGFVLLADTLGRRRLRAARS